MTATRRLLPSLAFALAACGGAPHDHAATHHAATSDHPTDGHHHPADSDGQAQLGHEHHHPSHAHGHDGPEAHDGTGGHAGHHDHRFVDPAKYAIRWNDPARDDWQQPARIVEAMRLAPGMAVADIGTGTGYFVPFLSAAVGAEGRVFAVDVEPTMLAWVDALATERGIANVTTVLADPHGPNLPDGAVDRILLVNTWHHIPSRAAYSARLRDALREGGEVWVVDLLPDAPDGPPPEHRLPPTVVIDELEGGGFSASVVALDLPRQYVVVGRRSP